MNTPNETNREIKNARIRNYLDIVAALGYFTVGICIAFDIIQFGYTQTVQWGLAGLFLVYSLFRGYRFVRNLKNK